MTVLAPFISQLVYIGLLQNSAIDSCADSSAIPSNKILSASSWMTVMRRIYRSINTVNSTVLLTSSFLSRSSPSPRLCEGRSPDCENVTRLRMWYMYIHIRTTATVSSRVARAD